MSVMLEYYVNKWFRLEHLPTNTSWVLLSSREIPYEHVVDLAKQIAPDLVENDDLFDEVSVSLFSLHCNEQIIPSYPHCVQVSQLNAILRQLPDESFNGDSVEEKWLKIFTKNDSLPCLFKIISRVLSVPASNAFIESFLFMWGAVDKRQIVFMWTQ